MIELLEKELLKETVDKSQKEYLMMLKQGIETVSKQLLNEIDKAINYSKNQEISYLLKTQIKNKESIETLSSYLIKDILLLIVVTNSNLKKVYSLLKQLIKRN